MRHRLEEEVAEVEVEVAVAAMARCYFVEVQVWAIQAEGQVFQAAVAVEAEESAVKKVACNKNGERRDGYAEWGSYLMRSEGIVNSVSGRLRHFHLVSVIRGPPPVSYRKPHTFLALRFPPHCPRRPLTRYTNAPSPASCIRLDWAITGH